MTATAANEAANTWFTEQFEAAEVTVDETYGTWQANPQPQVVPPARVITVIGLRPPTISTGFRGPSARSCSTRPDGDRSHRRTSRCGAARCTLGKLVTCDDLYEAGRSFEDVYRAIVERVPGDDIEGG